MNTGVECLSLQVEMAYVESSALLSRSSSDNYSSVHPTAPSGGGSPPPSYEDVGYMPSRAKACDVCNYRIDISNHSNSYVVPCPRCSETTALGNPPKGKKYIRCTCNKLLQCVKSATRVTCDRPGCGAVLQAEAAVTKGKTHHRNETERGREEEEMAEPHRERTYRFVCGHCESVSVLDTAPSSSSRCRHCGKRSSVGQSNKKAIGFITVGTVVVMLVIILMASTLTLKHNSGYWWLYLVGLIIAVFFHGYGLWLLCMKRSTVEVR